MAWLTHTQKICSNQDNNPKTKQVLQEQIGLYSPISLSHAEVLSTTGPFDLTMSI